MNFAKFQRTPFLQNTSEWVLLNIEIFVYRIIFLVEAKGRNIYLYDFSTSCEHAVYIPICLILICQFILSNIYLLISPAVKIIRT